MRTIQPAARNPGDHPWLAGFLKQFRREDLSQMTVRELSKRPPAVSPLVRISGAREADGGGHHELPQAYWFDRALQLADDGEVFKGNRAARIQGVNFAYNTLE